MELPGKATVIASGYAHCIAGLDDARTFAWGSGEQGQLGLGRDENLFTPREIVALKGLFCVNAGLGRAH